MSAEQCQVSHRNDRLKNQMDFLAVTDFKFWRICLVNMSVGMVDSFYFFIFAAGRPNINKWPGVKFGKISGKEKAHEHKQIFPLTARGGGGLPTGWPGPPDRWPGVKSSCAVCGTQGFIAISAASYTGAKCPTLKTAEKQPKRVPSGSR